MRIIRFTFLCNEQERKEIELLAKNLNRSQSDAIRELLRQSMHDRKDKLVVKNNREED